MLCPNCHKEIDKLPESFPAKLLIQMKQEHEEWANECLSREMSNISYAELDIICKAIANCVTDFLMLLIILQLKSKIKFVKIIYHLNVII